MTPHAAVPQERERGATIIAALFLLVLFTILLAGVFNALGRETAILYRFETTNQVRLTVDNTLESAQLALMENLDASSGDPSTGQFVGIPNTSALLCPTSGQLGQEQSLPHELTPKGVASSTWCVDATEIDDATQSVAVRITVTTTLNDIFASNSRIQGQLNVWDPNGRQFVEPLLRPFDTTTIWTENLTITRNPNVGGLVYAGACTDNGNDTCPKFTVTNVAPNTISDYSNLATSFQICRNGESLGALSAGLEAGKYCLTSLQDVSLDGGGLTTGGVRVISPQSPAIDLTISGRLTGHWSFVGFRDVTLTDEAKLTGRIVATGKCSHSGVLEGTITCPEVELFDGATITPLREHSDLVGLVADVTGEPRWTWRVQPDYPVNANPRD